MSSAVDLKTKEEKDAELDKRIEALRKKNEALVKRYQEIEEDKKKAEQEGIAITTPRKPRPHEPEADRRKTEKENLTVTVDLSKPAGEKRVVNDWKPATPRGQKTSEDSDGPRGQSDGHSPPRRTGSGRLGRGGQRGGGRQEKREWEPRTPREGEPGETGGQGRRGGRRGRGGEGGGGGGGGSTPGGGMDRKSKEWEEKRRQNIEKMNEEMERIAEYERGQRMDGDKPIRNFLDDPRRSGPVPDTDRKEGSRRHVRNWGGLDFDNVKTRAELEKEWTSRRPGPKGSVDMTMSMTGRERAEYLRWKKEREQIDEERLARHRNATGQWRREWDAQKTESMFKEEPCAAAEGDSSEQGGGRRVSPIDDGKRPPKAPTFGDFLSQGRTPGRGERSRGKGRGPRPSYSMHDNRWEGEKEEEGKEKEDKTKNVETVTKEKQKEEKPKAAATAAETVEEKNGGGEEDEDEWEDASDGEDDDDGSDSGHDSRGDEKKDTGKEKSNRVKGDSPTSPAPRSRPTSGESAKEQRTPRPKVHIPAPEAVQESPEGGKPLSPFSPLDGHQPVSDWGEEMEMLSPRSSMGGESPLKPPSTENSPPQKKEEMSGCCSEAAEPQTEESPEVPAQQTVMVSEPELVPSDPSQSEVSVCDPSAVSAPVPSEVSEAAVTMDQDAPALSQPQDNLDAPPSPSDLDAEQSSSDPAEEQEAPPAGPTAADPSAPPSSG
ncbi:coiled-coil domain-containing protein 9 isoform X2 [Betta splendens]|uniref:Coiled-coil domain-containing protein 9 isoform X2 n=1 Tax=Betta splendens TaxID=158456 RepID=A0A9W2Y7E6_BETSP|nr:coiled-coil domain-containing protein 9 isoform X2 [Betta splendens]